MSKEGRKSRRNQIIIAIIGAFGIILAAVITNSLNNSDNKLDAENKGVIDNSEDNINGTLNKANVGNNSGTINNGSQTTNNYQVVEESSKGFRIKGSPELMRQLLKSNQIIISQVANNIIELSYTGELVEISDNSGIFIYNSGALKLLINDQTCKIFEEFNLDYLKSGSKESILLELEKRIDQIVKSNFNQIQKAILECI